MKQDFLYQEVRWGKLSEIRDTISRKLDWANDFRKEVMKKEEVWRRGSFSAFFLH